MSQYKKSDNVEQFLWDQAQAANPDKSCMVPVLACGFDALKERMNLQDQILKAHRSRLDEDKLKIEGLMAKHAVENVVKIKERERKTKELKIRVMKVHLSISS